MKKLITAMLSLLLVFSLLSGQAAKVKPPRLVLLVMQEGKPASPLKAMEAGKLSTRTSPRCLTRAWFLLCLRAIPGSLQG